MSKKTRTVFGYVSYLTNSPLGEERRYFADAITRDEGLVAARIRAINEGVHADVAQLFIAAIETVFGGENGPRTEIVAALPGRDSVSRIEVRQ